MSDDEFIASFENSTLDNASFHHCDHVRMAFLLLIRERMARSSNPQTWQQFAAGNPDLLNWKDNILKKYYRDETLSSELAKRVFLFPDTALH